jgi:hypothetical protein
MSYVFEWPESEKFASAYACRFLPRSGNSRFQNTFVGPIFNLFDLTRPFVLLFSWFLFFVLFGLVYYVLPIGLINSTDGQYLAVSRCLLSSFILYYILSIFLVGILSDRGCQSLEEQANAYLYIEPATVPSTLQDSASIVYAKKREREAMQALKRAEAFGTT